MFIHNLNMLYLSVGGYNEILNMSYWDFVVILLTNNKIKQRQSGGPVVQEGLYQSQKDMIANAKAFRK